MSWKAIDLFRLRLSAKSNLHLRKNVQESLKYLKMLSPSQNDDTVDYDHGLLQVSVVELIILAVWFQKFESVTTPEAFKPQKRDRKSLILGQVVHEAELNFLLKRGSARRRKERDEGEDDVDEFWYLRKERWECVGILKSHSLSTNFDIFGLGFQL